MTAILITLAITGTLGCLGTGVLSPDRGLAVAVAWYRLRYACGPAEAAAGLAVTLAAAAACTAGGAAFLAARAARYACESADRAAIRTIPVMAGKD